MFSQMLKIIENREIANNIHLLVLETEREGMAPNLDEAKPGQFVYIRVSESYEPLLRRPISIHDYDPKTQHLKLIYRLEGEGTRRISHKKTGDYLDVFGPLGNGYDILNDKKEEKVVLIGGGVGIPPLYYLAKKLVEHGRKVTTLLGFQSRKDAFLIEDFAALGEVRIATIDGSLGEKGTVLHLIHGDEQWETFYTCGPNGMMKAIQNTWLNTEMNGFVSLEERMGCGIGACYGCIVKTDRSIDQKGYKKVCSDGPVFSFREVLL